MKTTKNNSTIADIKLSVAITDWLRGEYGLGDDDCLSAGDVAECVEMAVNYFISQALDTAFQEWAEAVRMEKIDDEIQQPYLNHVKNDSTNCCYCSLCGFSEMNMVEDENGEFACSCSVWSSSFKGNWLRWIDGSGEEARKYRNMFYPNAYNQAVDELNKKLQELGE